MFLNKLLELRERTEKSKEENETKTKAKTNKNSRKFSFFYGIERNEETPKKCF